MKLRQNYEKIFGRGMPRPYPPPTGKEGEGGEITS